MANPYKRIGSAKLGGGNVPGSTVTAGGRFTFPDNLGDPSSGGQHFMLIRAYDFADPAMTSAKTFNPPNPDKKDNTLMVPVSWVCALFIPPAALKQAYSAKYQTLDYAGAVAAGAGGKAWGVDAAKTAQGWAQKAGGSGMANFFQGSRK